MKFQTILNSRIPKLLGLIIVFFLCATSLAISNPYAPYPEAGAGYVTDIADLLTDEEEEQIEKWLWKAEYKKGLEVAVVTIESIRDYPGTDNGSIAQFATGLFNAYQIGNMPRNNGILFLVARKDRKARIELGAFYGRAYDDKSSRIMQGVIVPKFKSGHYDQGIINGTKSILAQFSGMHPVTTRQLYGGGISFGVVLMMVASLFWSGKRGWAWLVISLVMWVVSKITTALANVLAEMPTGSSDNWDSGGFGGGFGGGSSGGGGATGSW